MQLRWLVVNAIINLIAANAIDRIAMGENSDTAMAIRILLVTPAFLAGIALHRCSSNLTLRSFVTGAINVIYIATIAILAQFATESFSSRYLLVAIFIQFVAILFAGLSWRATQMMSAAAFVAFSVFAMIDGNMKIIPINIDLIFLCGLTTGLALVLRRRTDSQLSEILAMREIDATHVRELNKANAQLAVLSNTDPLTGLFNRRYLHAYFNDFTSSLVPHIGYGVLLIDVDHFKQLNDRLGHAEGDRCLRLVAAAIAKSPRSADDIAVRYGGEEFLIILRDADAGKTLAIAERLRQNVMDLRFPNPGAGAGGIVTVSIGVHIARTAEPIADAVRTADEMLYAAKRSGRNRVSISGCLTERIA